MKDIFYFKKSGNYYYGRLTGRVINDKLEFRETDNTLHYVFKHEIKELENETYI